MSEAIEYMSLMQMGVSSLFGGFYFCDLIGFVHQNPPIPSYVTMIIVIALAFELILIDIRYLMG